ncbi:MAG: phosphatidate cytidylyltransferase [Taibaiella sp.]|nr:phosphatidate cytidylyltransferase [Taibaiella sp.]
MALNMPTFYKRTGSAIVFAAIMLTGLLWRDAYIFTFLTFLISILCLREYFLLMQKIDGDAHWPAWLPLVVQIVSVFFVFIFSPLGSNPNAGPLWTVFKLMPMIAAAMLMGATLFPKSGLKAALYAFGGLLYITLPMILFGRLRAYDYVLPIAVVGMVWINDTMAYIVGSFIGKTPFSPISPKKTWEGTAGGALLTIITAGIYGALPVTYNIEGAGKLHWIMIALIVATTGTLGDLFESKLKRMADVKDSGNIMPGHGGALDRFDSIIIAIPFVYVYYSLFMM